MCAFDRVQAELTQCGDVQLAAEMHQMHQGGDVAGLPILVPSLAAQMMNKK